MMRRFTYLFTLILCLLAVVGASADDISLSEARSLASQYVETPSIQKSKMNKVAAAAGKFMKDFYCFNDAGGKGFVLISDDDCVQPILGYSDSGTFDVDNVPVQLQDWLTAVSQYISQNKATGKTVAAQKVKGTPVVSPLLTTKWSQRAPYNGMTPIAGAATGCWATAMAQIVNYHKWPVRGIGSRTYTLYCPDKLAYATYTTKEISMDFSQSVYDYANMLDEYKTTKAGNQWNEAQAAAVSKLMLDCGVATSMQYGVTGSGAWTEDAAYGLSEYFGYQTHCYVRQMMSTPEFQKIITDELDGKYPVCMCSIPSFMNGAHAFVLDGYDSNGYLHANIGWGGQSDGYYDLCDISKYCFTQEIVTAHPNHTGEASHYDYQLYFHHYSPDAFHHGGTDIIDKPVDSFTVTMDSLYSCSYNDYEGYEGLALYRGKNFVCLLDTAHVRMPRIISLYRNDVITYLDSLTLSVPKSLLDTLSDGEYTIVPVSIGSRMMKAGSMIGAEQITKNDIDQNLSTLSLTLSSGRMTVRCFKQSDTLSLKCQFTPDTVYRVGVYDKLSLPVKITNPGIDEQQISLLATLTKAGTTACDTLYDKPYLLIDHYTRIFEANKQIISKSQVGRYVYSLGYYDNNGTYVPLITSADSVMAEIYADSTCEKPTLTATLDSVTDYYTGKIWEMDNLRTGGEGEPTTYTLHYKVKYTGKTNVPYTLRSTVNGIDLGVYVTLTYNLSDTIHAFPGNINDVYQKLHTYYGITTFKFAMEYKLPDDTEWQPLDKNRPYLVINPVASGISTVQSADGDVDASAPYYTLQGMKIQQPVQKGLYIHKGKKVVVR